MSNLAKITGLFNIVIYASSTCTLHFSSHRYSVFSNLVFLTRTWRFTRLHYASIALVQVLFVGIDEVLTVVYCGMMMSEVVGWPLV